MERFTTDILEVFKSARQEINLFEVGQEEQLILSFSEFPTIAGFPYKIAFFENSFGKIRSAIRQWDTAYNMKHSDKGIYNLDRLRIVAQEQLLSDAETILLQKLFLELKSEILPTTLDNKTGIVLDGSEWELVLNYSDINQQYKWRAAKEEIKLFVPIIELILKFYDIKRS